MAASAGAVRAGGAFIEIFAKDGAFQQTMTRVQNRLKAVSASMRQIGTNLSIGGAALGAPFVIAAGEAANFTLAMAQVRANTSATEEQFKRLNAAAREMGVAMGKSPTETANAMNELAKAGLDAEGTIRAVGPVLALAAADNMGLARAVEVVVGTMSQFGMATSDFGSIADRLQAAANASTTSVDLIGESLSYVGPQAQMAGQSFDDVAAALGTLAQGGIRGSMAGTQLARVLEAMGSEEAKFNKLGVSVRDAQGNLRPFMDVVRDLGTATAGMNNADRMQAFMDIFDIRGARAAATLSQLGGEFDRILGTIQGSAGAAAGKAGQVLQSFGGQVQVLAAKFADLKIAVITSMGTTATAVVQGLGRALEIVTQFIQRNPQLVATVAAVAGGMLALGIAATTASIGLRVIASGMGVLKSVLQVIPALFTPVGLAATAAFAAVAAGVVVARTLSPAFKAETDAIWKAITQLDFGTAWQIMNLNFSIALMQMSKAASGFLGTIQGTFTSAGAFVGDMLTQGLDRFMGLFGADIITLQNGFERLGIYFRAAFDWKFALTGMGAAIKAADAAAEKARARAPTADARAADRAAARQRAANGRQEAMDKDAAGWDGVIEELRKDLARAKGRLEEKPAAKADAPAWVAQAREDRGVMPPGMGAAAEAGAAAGIGQTVGTFSSTGEGLGIGPELNKLEQPAIQTAANTARAAGALEQMLAANRIEPAAAGGGVAAGVVAPLAAPVAARAQAGVAQVADAQALFNSLDSRLDALVKVSTEHLAVAKESRTYFGTMVRALEKGYQTIFS
jgi:TP901 family phage tail tape measure protein